MKQNTFIQKITRFLQKNKHALFALYFPVYILCFSWLESRNNVSFTDIHCFVDDWIPFCEIFIIPYVLWFFYVAGVLAYLYFQRAHLGDFYRCSITLILGMSTCLFIYYIFPNEQNMRPDTFAHSNLFTDIIQFIYASDTDTNVLPSIHVYNSIAIHAALAGSYGLRKKKTGIRIASLLLCILICLSTMFLKQHSFLDVITAGLLFAVYYVLIYHVLPTRRL